MPRLKAKRIYRRARPDSFMWCYCPLSHSIEPVTQSPRQPEKKGSFEKLYFSFKSGLAQVCILHVFFTGVETVKAAISRCG